MKKEITYKLMGLMVSTDWYGRRGFNHLLIETTPQGLEKIEKEPLQDYINFGVQSVDYVIFQVFQVEKYKRGGRVYVRETLNPVKEIEAGTLEVSDKEQEFIIELLSLPPDIIHYK